MTIIPVDSLEDGRWYAQREQVDISGQETQFVELIEALSRKRPLTGKKYNQTMRTYVRRGLPWLNKGQIIDIYARLCDQGTMEFDPELRVLLQMKPTRSQAGVTVVTVLTKPYPCPGECVFCPTDVRMPKSYLHDEPGAQRAERHGFDPYDPNDSSYPRAGANRPSGRKNRTAHFGRHLVQLPARLPGMVRQTLF